MGLDNGAHFLCEHTRRYHRSFILRRAIGEVQHNWSTYKYYSIDWMAHEDDADRYLGMPEFQWQWLEALLQLDLDSYSLVTENLVRDLSACIARLEILNDPIRELNTDLPPLYIRRQREDLRDVPEDRQGKRRAKASLFQHLQARKEYGDVRWYLGQLIRIFMEMLNTVPDQGGPRAYGYSAPDYRGWV